ncbi:MAG: endonuclease [Holophagales bacterium]|nr:endonuclease [Holophagales bacterium]
MSQTTVRRSAGLSSVQGPALLNAVVAIAFAAALAGPAAAQRLTEVVFDHAGPDTHEYVEVHASPGASLSGYTLVGLDGSAGGDPGKILHVFTPTTANDAGFWTTGYLTSTLDGPAFTILLVSGFTGAIGQDLDAGNDGALDVVPWTSVLDGVAFSDGGAGALTYASPVLGPGFDGNATAPGGASRFPYWRDTDSVTDWKRNDFDGDGLPTFPGSLAPGEARNTPGSVTRVNVADYWAAVDASNPSDLRTTVHAAIENHVAFPYSAGTTDTRDILNLADEDPVDTTRILDIYRNASYVKTPGGDAEYNKEHSWPKSYGFPEESTIPHSDCHHLFASDKPYNSNRGNKPFGTCNSGCTENPTLLNHEIGGGNGTYPGNSNWTNASVYEVWNHRRGDIARAQLYMDVRYEGGAHAVTGASEPDLVLTDDMSLVVMTSSSPAYMGKLSTLLQWHLEDPVDDDERARNDVIEAFQGNRNPFVDHPEWVECVFSATCGGNPALLFSGLKSATDPSLCAVSGVDLAWNVPSAWNDGCTSGCDRGFRILRDGVAISTGGCAGPFSASATSCADATGVTGMSYAYAVEAFNHEGETSTGNGPISAADRTDDDLPPAFASGPSASSAAPSSFTVTWTTDEPSDSRLEYGATASYGSTAHDATLVTTHSLTVTGLSATTEYHFRAGSTDPCGNGPTWSADGTVTTAAVSTALDVGGYTLTQANSTQTYTLPAGTTVPAGGYVVIARNADKAAFETAWSVTLGPDVVFLNSGEQAPMINGGETYTLTNAMGAVVDGPTIALSSTFPSVRRNDPCLPAGSAGSWTAGAVSSATPGSGAGAGCGTGLVVNEFSDASAFANEFVELHWDSPAAAPAATTEAATDVTTTGATLNGTANPNGAATIVSFEWGPTPSYGQTTAGQAVGAGTTAQAISAVLTDIAPCTTIHYRARATSAGGTTTGDDASFRTACTGGRFHALTPCRVLDTRFDAPIAVGAPRVVSFHGICGIPASARALASNFTVTESSSAGWVSAYPADVASTETSVVAFGAGRTRASNTILKLSGDGTGRARLEATVPGAGTVHVIVDVAGYFD